MGYINELRSLVGHRPLIMAGAAVLIFDELNRLLLHHRNDNNQWGLIGGSMEIGETLEETAKREAYEETGLKLENLEWLDLFSGPDLIYQYPNGDVVVNVTAAYICRQFKEEPKTDKAESNELRFFPLDQLPKEISPPDRPILKRFLAEDTKSMDTTAQTPDTVYTIYIAATPARVWEALTSPKISKQYFFGRSVESDWQVGSPFILRMADGRIDTQGKVLQCELHRLLSVSWHVEWMEEMRHLPSCIVTYQIEPLGPVVRLTMTESHPEPIDPKYLEGGRRGWPIILSGLKTLLETGHPLPEFDGMK